MWLLTYRLFLNVRVFFGIIRWILKSCLWPLGDTFRVMFRLIQREVFDGLSKVVIYEIFKVTFFNRIEVLKLILQMKRNLVIFWPSRIFRRFQINVEFLQLVGLPLREIPRAQVVWKLIFWSLIILSKRWLNLLTLIRPS